MPKKEKNGNIKIILDFIAFVVLAFFQAAIWLGLWKGLDEAQTYFVITALVMLIMLIWFHLYIELRLRKFTK